MTDYGVLFCYVLNLLIFRWGGGAICDPFIWLWMTLRVVFLVSAVSKMRSNLLLFLFGSLLTVSWNNDIHLTVRIFQL